MYRVSKILNNNGVIAINTEDNQEYVLLGKGISELELKSMLGFFRKQKYMFTKWTKVDITKELSAKISQEVYA